MKDEIKEIVSMSADEDIEIKYINERGSYVYKNIDIYELLDYITNLQEENERLNNIINELEKDIKNLYTYGIKNNAEQRDYLLNRLDGLKELKENK